MAVSSSGITMLLRAWSSGDDQALDRLTSVLYGELYRLAQCHMARENPGHILQNTALVNEIYLRLADVRETDWKDRSHFFAVCSQLMRRILTDYARSRLYLKRGGDATLVSLDEDMAVSGSRNDLVALDDALNTLAAIDERKSQVVQLRFFGGFSVKETAEALKVSERTIKGEWRFAKLWLLRELDKGKSNGNGKRPLAATTRIV